MEDNSYELYYSVNFNLLIIFALSMWTTPIRVNAPEDKAKSPIQVHNDFKVDMYHTKYYGWNHNFPLMQDQLISCINELDNLGALTSTGNEQVRFIDKTQERNKPYQH